MFLTSVLELPMHNNNTKDISFLCVLEFLYLPFVPWLVFLLYYWVGLQLHWPPAPVWIAFVVSIIASLFITLIDVELRSRVIIVVLLGIISVVILVTTKISQEYIIPASGFSFIAGAITLVRGQHVNMKPDEVRDFTFRLISVMALAGGAFIIAMSVSDWNWWNHMVGNILSDSVAASSASNSLAGNSTNSLSFNWANNAAQRAADGFFAMALYYFLGIGMIVMEITQPKASRS